MCMSQDNTISNESVTFAHFLSSSKIFYYFHLMNSNYIYLDSQVYGIRIILGGLCGQWMTNFCFVFAIMDPTQSQIDLLQHYQCILSTSYPLHWLFKIKYNQHNSTGSLAYLPTTKPNCLRQRCNVQIHLDTGLTLPNSRRFLPGH